MEFDNLKSGFSIVVCCYNSEKRILDTLKHLLRLDYPHEKYEILLVDNNCTDNTVLVATELMRQYPTISFVVVKENRRGLASARRGGVRAASYQDIVFCDDDNWLDKSYLSVSERVLKMDAHIGALGGRGELVSDAASPPVWFSSFQNAYAVGVQGLSSGSVNARKYLWGAGLVVRGELMRSIYFDLGLEAMCAGRSGASLGAGDDSELSRWVLWLGYDLWYEEELVYKHFIPSGRQTEEYYASMTEGFYRSREVLGRMDRVWESTNKRSIGGKLKLVANIYKELLRGDHNKMLQSIELLGVFPFELDEIISHYKRAAKKIEHFKRGQAKNGK